MNPKIHTEYRHVSYAPIADTPNAPPRPHLNVSEQGLLARQAFDRHIKQQSLQPQTSLHSSDAFDDPERLHIKASEDRRECYQWLESIDPAVLDRFAAEVTQFRHTWRQTHQSDPSTLRLYRHFRSQLEVEQPDEYIQNAVVIFDALVNGDFVTGQLPF